MRQKLLPLFLFLTLLVGVSYGFPRGGNPVMTGPFMQERPEMGFGMQFWMNPDFPDENIRKLLFRHREKMEDIFLESRKERNSLEYERRELYFKLKELSERYREDKKVSKDIIEITKKIYEITQKLQKINQETMQKLQKLNEEREKEFNELYQKWLKRIETDENALSAYINWINERQYGGYMRIKRGRKR